MIASRLARAAGILAISAGAVFNAAAQPAADAYPSKPIHFIVPFAPARGADVARGAALAAHSPPDGYTIAFAYSGTHAINPSLYPDAGFKNSDFAPVILMMSVPEVLTVNANVPANSVKELVALAKSKPGELNFASSAAFNLVTAVLFNEMAGITITHIPYGGGAAATTALLQGDVTYQFTDPPAVLPFVKSGRLRAIAVTSGKRSSLFPDLPTVAEAGLPGYEATSWNGIVVPAGTPAPIIAKLNSEINKILAAPDMRAKLADLGYEAVGGTPEQFGAHIVSEEAKWGKVVKAANMKP
jgi:tripartite-type tricarboxylate transporter receptor subunit TctC